MAMLRWVVIDGDGEAISSHPTKNDAWKAHDQYGIVGSDVSENCDVCPECQEEFQPSASPGTCGVCGAHDGLPDQVAI